MFLSTVYAFAALSFLVYGSGVRSLYNSVPISYAELRRAIKLVSVVTVGFTAVFAVQSALNWFSFFRRKQFVASFYVWETLFLLLEVVPLSALLTVLGRSSIPRELTDTAAA